MPSLIAEPQKQTPKKRSRLKQSIIASALAVTVVAGGGTAWALDRFVIDHVEISDVSAYEASVSAATGSAGTTDSGTAGTNSAGADSSPTDSSGADSSGADSSGAAPVITDTSYQSADSTINISTVVTGTGDSTVTYYVADVYLDDATELKSAFADDSFGENIIENTSAIAADNNAIFAINGDYYGFRDTGIVIRNGVVFRDDGARQGLAFYRDGSVQLYDETTTTADELVANGVWNTLSFGPALLQDGQVVDGIDNVEVDTNFGNHSIQGAQPRTAVGVIAPNHLVFVAVDGRSPGYSAGVTMTGLAQIMAGLGAITAYNLDGGGSTTMYFNGNLVNNPLGKNDERGTSDILYIAS